MNRFELRVARQSAIPDERAAEPSLSTLDTAALADRLIERPIGRAVWPSRGCDLWISEERGKCGKRTIQAVISASGYCCAAIVDQLPVWVGPWVSADLEPIVSAKRVLDSSLVLSPFHRLKFVTAEPSKVGRVTEPSWRIARRDVVAESADIVWSESEVSTGRDGWETELVAELIRDRFSVAVRRNRTEIVTIVVNGELEMGFGWVGGEHHVDQEGVTAE
nr:hypothetical protein [Nocardia cyriacigeorgica]